MLIAKEKIKSGFGKATYAEKGDEIIIREEYDHVLLCENKRTRERFATNASMLTEIELIKDEPKVSKIEEEIKQLEKQISEVSLIPQETVFEKKKKEAKQAANLQQRLF